MDVGVIGTGQMGKNHVRVYSELKEVGDVYVYDLQKDATNQVSKDYGAFAASNIRELIHEVDAVSVCVPTPYHFNTVWELLKEDNHILIEKPLCQRAEEAKKLIELISRDIIIGVGHIERFNPIVSEIKNMIKDPLFVELKRHNPASNRLSGTSNIVEDLMIHDIDIILHSLFSGTPLIHAMGTEDVASVQMRYNQSIIQVSASRKSSKKIRMIHIEQEDMTIEGDFMTQEVYVYRKPGKYNVENERYVQENIVEKVQVAKKEPLREELQTFLSCIKTSTPFPVTPIQALENIEMCEIITNQMKQ
ncbi:Gfo/Idh/MocA family protein [Methanospirillum lacunae]|uniref:Gfo/Idh/MocA family oxidoreductase n=1 Tax=Methanospirillum lacunae TaxID=668570 RepID=A0A2V2N2U6_9EURY|nr:Gfo/Idh/MocA family oxidoreductase [Methanospirillum lacunae]PWR72865.1 gfo/Idh/MocA family oxidoreductase [Methanospirillum lacunae]